MFFKIDKWTRPRNIKTDTTLYMLPLNTNDNITSIINNSFENVVKQLIKQIKQLQGTYKRIVNPGPRIEYFLYL